MLAMRKIRQLQQARARGATNGDRKLTAYTVQVDLQQAIAGVSGVT